MAGEVAQLILGLRQRRRYWGPRKLKAVLEHNHPELSIPAASTIGDCCAAVVFAARAGAGCELRRDGRLRKSRLLTICGVPILRAGFVPRTASAVIR